MAFVTDTQVKNSVAAALSQIAANLDAKWTQLIADANVAAYDQIKLRFIKLGYTLAEIDAWDMGATFNLFLARYQALIDGAGDKTQVEEWRTELDYWRGQLEEQQEVIDASAVDTPADAAGTVGHGSLSTAKDLFVLDPDDTRIGQVTEW